MAEIRVNFRDFTFSRKGGNTLVAEASDLEPFRKVYPDEFVVVGQHKEVRYKRARHEDVMDAGNEDMVAAVYRAVDGRGRPERAPAVHILND